MYCEADVETVEHMQLINDQQDFSGGIRKVVCKMTQMLSVKCVLDSALR